MNVTKDNKSKRVICIFQRDEIDSDKGELIAIFAEPKGALDFLEKSNIPDLFYEAWFIHDDFKPLNIIGIKTSDEK